MTPIEIRRSSDQAIASLQAMRDAADAADGLPVEPYAGPMPEIYSRILQEWIADLAVPAVSPMAPMGWGIRR